MTDNAHKLKCARSATKRALGLAKWYHTIQHPTGMQNLLLESLLMQRMQCYEMVYGAKPDVTHLHAFGTLCAIVAKERLKKIMTMW